MLETRLVPLTREHGGLVRLMGRPRARYNATLQSAFDAAPSYDSLVEKLDDRFSDHWWFDAGKFLLDVFGIEPPDA